MTKLTDKEIRDIARTIPGENWNNETLTLFARAVLHEGHAGTVVPPSHRSTSPSFIPGGRPGGASGTTRLQELGSMVTQSRTDSTSPRGFATELESSIMGRLRSAIDAIYAAKKINDALQSNIPADSRQWNAHENIDDRLHEALAALGD